MSSPASSRPDPYRRSPSNLLRLDLYKYLLPRIQEEDQASGAFGYIYHWDDPGSSWDTGNPADTWDALGFAPVIQTLFYVLETMEGEDIGTIESLDALVDPYTCPADYLPFLSASLGYDLEETIPEEKRRVVVAGLIDAFKRAGQWVGFKIFYRMAGFRVIRIYPLWKKNIFEGRQDYSRVRYSTAAVTGEYMGPGGQTAYSGRIAGTPVKPQTIRITDGVVVVRDDPAPSTSGLFAGAEATLLGPSGVVGAVNYNTGAFTINLPVPTAATLLADYETIDEEWPYHAARLDIEILLNPGGDLVNPIPFVDAEVVRNIIARAEESRPIHVLLRAVALVAEMHDTLSPGASDTQACTQVLKDVREGSPHLLVPGRNNTYMLDFAPDMARDVGHIDEVVSGLLSRRRYLFEEQAPLICPMDAMIIDGPPGGPIYA